MDMTESSASDQTPAPSLKTASTISPIVMKTYYEQFYPFKLFGRWLGYGTIGATTEGIKNIFSLREWSFTLDIAGADVYQRYQSFENADALRDHVIKVCPAKIDIGAICNVMPKEHRKVREFRCETREFVVDIDMTDYDDVRTCCNGTAICDKCWKFLAIAMRIIHTSLTEDFGFQHVMWFFSGRRGVHCWVSDETARNLTNEQRSAVAEFLSVTRATVTNPLHPALQRGMDVIREHFEEVVVDDQGLLDSRDKFEAFVSRAFEGDMQAKLCELWDSHGKRPRDLLNKVVNTVEKEIKPSKQGIELRKSLTWLYLSHAYPRIDVNVSIQINHLLKAPFCVHPKTGFICVPISPDQFESFRPGNAPSVFGLVDADDADNASAKGFKAAIAQMEGFIKRLETSIRKSRIEKQQANTMDW
eukprot:c4522_g1_i1.p1 GENE.c4522_g1_i1~~c4522_g1_i1.p1  ORF type:complete len:431 (-),score=96.65 c4522_g1_i1:1035-2285(-)